jgi:hypothetical protein
MPNLRRTTIGEQLDQRNPSAFREVHGGDLLLRPLQNLADG